MSTIDATVRVNASRRAPLRRIWRFVGYDEPNYTYTRRGLELLGKLGSLCDAPYFVRCHFMLATGDGTGSPKWGSTNVYTLDEEGEPRYSFEIVDRILDAQIDSGCVPFVEIGFMPQALSTAPPDVPYEAIREAGWAYPPSDYSRWADLIRELARHCLRRYGLGEVSRWYWELWNEPDIFYWAGTADEYFRLYDYTEWALHSVLPQAKLGGPSVTGPGDAKAAAFLERFLEHCVRGENAVTGEIGTRLDLVTFHAKGGGYGRDPQATKETPTIARLVGHVEAGLQVLAGFPELAGVEVNLSECDPDGWAAGGRHDNPNLAFRNTEYYASYLARAVCELVDAAAPGAAVSAGGGGPLPGAASNGAAGPNRVDGMLTWAFQFEDGEYFEGRRCLSTNGLDKPVLNVFRLLAMLGGARLEADVAAAGAGNAARAVDADGGAPSVLAAADGTGGVQVLLVRHADDWDEREESIVRVRVCGLVPGREYQPTEWRVDRANANAYAAWTAMGSPQDPSTAERRRLEESARLRPTPHPAATADADGVLTVSVRLDVHAVCLLTLA